MYVDVSVDFVPDADKPPDTAGAGEDTPSFGALEPIGGRTGDAERLEPPDEGAGLGVSLLLTPALPAAVALLILPAIFRITINVNIPGKRLPSGSPVIAGESPIRAIKPSIFLPAFASATTKTVHGKTAAPEGTTDIADSTNLRKTTLKTIIRHILPNIRTQPLNISEVFLLPPIANAKGDRIVNIETITYRSPISKNSLMS